MATNNMYQERIQQNQKFLLRLLNLHIGHYYPLRKWLGISYKGKIDDISHLSFGYNTKYFKKKGQWYKQQTREYQQPDLGYKLNLVLDKIPQLALLPALLQPAYGLGALAFFFLTQTTYQPSDADTYIINYYSTTNYGTSAGVMCANNGSNWISKGLFHFNLSDIPNNAVFSQGDLSLHLYICDGTATATMYMYRLLRTDWVENQATWEIYKTGSNWTTAGAGSSGNDYSPDNSCSSSVSRTTNEWKAWEMSDLVQDCFDNYNKNIHLLLAKTNVSSGSWLFYSKEYTDDTSLRPKLTVTYTYTVSSNFFPFF